MSNITMYTSSFCPYCIQAKRLLNNKGIEFIEINVGKEPELRQEMIAKSQRSTVPQIFNRDKHIGDCTELFAFETNGELDALLA